MLVSDSREATEPQLYLVRLDRAPRSLKLRLAANASVGKSAYDYVSFSEGAAGTDGLVEEDDDDADARIERIQEWLNWVLISDNVFRPPFTGTVDFSVCLATE